MYNNVDAFNMCIYICTIILATDAVCCPDMNIENAMLLNL